MRIKYKHILFLFIISLALISLSLPVEASLSSKYESPAAKTEGAAAVKPAAVKTPQTQQQTSKPSKKTVSAKDLNVVARYEIPKKYINSMEKEHVRFCKAYADAEMGLRYFFKTGYDATKGKRAPSQQQIQSMRFEIKLLLKDLSSSAKRYERNIKFAKLAMDSMTPEEKSFFVLVLSRIFGTPAYADDGGWTPDPNYGFDDMMSSLADSFGQTAVAAETANIGMDDVDPSDFGKVGNQVESSFSDSWDSFSSSKSANVMATGAKLVTGTVLTVATIVGGTAIVSTAPVTGGILVIGGIIGGGFEFVSSTIGFVDAVYGKETNTKDLELIDNISRWTSLPVTIVNPGKGAVEISTNVLSGTKDFWVPWMTGSDDPQCPGRNGANAVKKAKETNSGGGGSGGGGGGSGSGGGCGGGC